MTEAELHLPLHLGQVLWFHPQSLRTMCPSDGQTHIQSSVLLCHQQPAHTAVKDRVSLWSLVMGFFMPQFRKEGKTLT